MSFLRVTTTNICLLCASLAVAASAQAQPAANAAAPLDTEASKKHKSAIDLALRWLVEHQQADGSWSFEHRGGECDGRCTHPGRLTTAPNAATALALLPMLGAGQTPDEGAHQEAIRRGLDYLLAHAKIDDDRASFSEKGGTMYSHGLCTLALCEAFRMSNDPKVGERAQQALNFTVMAQDPVGGGWRYLPRQPGDTSVTGLQMAALASGQAAGLKVPEDTVPKAMQFLDAVQANNGATYGYTTPGPKATTTAIGLLARLRGGWPSDHDAVQRGAGLLTDAGFSERDLYFNFHAAQVLSRQTDDAALEWQNGLREFLVNQQATEGHEAGSWFVPGNHGADRGGRVYCTALAALTLEIYYRHLSIFQIADDPEE